MKKLISIITSLCLCGMASFSIAQVANFTITGNPLKCKNQSFTFTNTSTGATSYYWDFGDGTSSTVQNPTHAYSSGGSFLVRLTATSGTSSNSRYQGVYVSKVPNAYFYFENWGDIVQNTEFRLVNNTSNASGYIWNFGDGTFSNAIHARKSYPNPGYYDIRLKAYNNCGDTSESTNQVHVIDTNSMIPMAAGSINPTLACPETYINFSNYSSYFTKAIWNFGDGKTFESNMQSIQYKYSAKGVYKVKLFVYNKSNVDSMDFTVNITDTSMIMPYSGVQPMKYIGGNYVPATCPGQPFWLNSGNDENIKSKYWRLQNGIIIPANTDTSVIYSTEGTRNVWFVAENFCGVKDSVVYSLKVLKPDSFKYTYSGIIVNPNNGVVCPGDKISLMSGVYETGYSFTWKVNGVTVGNTSQVEYTTPSTAGNLNIKLYLTPGCGVSDSLSKLVTTNSSTTPTAQFSSSYQQEVPECYGDSVYFFSGYYNDPNVVTHYWDFGDGTTSTLADPAHKYSSYGWKTVVHGVKSSCGNNAYMVSAYNLISNKAPRPRFEIHPPTVCAGDSASLNNYTFDADSSVILTGDGGTIITRYGAMPHLFYAYKNPGTYRATLYVFNRCSYDSAYASVTIVPRPVVHIINNDTTIKINQTLIFTKDPTPFSRHFWARDLNGHDMAETESYSVNFNELGVQKVYLFAENMNGCKNIDSVKITVVNNPIGMMEFINEGSSVKVYPNPMQEKLTIAVNCRREANLNIEFYSLNGKLIKSFYNESLKEGEYLFEKSVSDLPSGIYYCKLSLNDEVVFYKLIK